MCLFIQRTFRAPAILEQHDRNLAFISCPSHDLFFFFKQETTTKIAECVEAPPFRARPLGRPSCFPCPVLLLPGGAGGVDCGPWGPRCCPPGCSPGRAQGGGEGGAGALGKAHPPASTHGQRPDSVRHSLLFLPGATGRFSPQTQDRAWAVSPFFGDEEMEGRAAWLPLLLVHPH